MNNRYKYKATQFSSVLILLTSLALCRPAAAETIFPDSKVATANSGFQGFHYELGTIFSSSVAGDITHLRVYSIAAESGDHLARLWRNSDNTAIGGPYVWNYGGSEGWITLDIPDVGIAPNVDYTVSISTGGDPGRFYPYIPADLLSSGGNGLHLSYPAGAGVYTLDQGTRPTESFNGNNYLRDVVFVPVPEPGALALLLCGAGMVLLGRRKFGVTPRRD